MKSSFVRHAFAAVLFVLLAGCGRSQHRGNQALSVPSTDAQPRLSVIALDSSGKPVADTAAIVGTSVKATSAGEEVVVTYAGASRPAFVYLQVTYPAAQFEYTSAFLAPKVQSDTRTISLGVSPFPGRADIGVVAVQNGSLPIEPGDKLVTIELSNSANDQRRPAKKLSAAPVGQENAPRDFKVILTAGTVTLTWTEQNAGDYNLDGTVSIADIGVLASKYGGRVQYNDAGNLAGFPSTPEYYWNATRAAADGNRDGEVGIGDLRVIADHYGATLAGYNIYRGSTLVGQTPTLVRPAPEWPFALQYQYVDAQSGLDTTYSIRPVDALGNEGVETTGNTSTGAAAREWTVMFYFAGDDDLGGPCYSILKGLEEYLYHPTGLGTQASFVAEAKLRADPGTYERPQSNMAFRYSMQPSNRTADLNFGPGSYYQDLGFSTFNSADPQSITKFIQWASTNFPANHFALLLGGHGHSWQPGAKGPSALLDDESNNQMMFDGDAAASIADSHVHIDVLVLESCLMGTVEVADEFKDVCDYVVFSENALVEDDMGGLLQALNQPTISAEQLAKECVDCYVAGFRADPATNAMTLSAVKTSFIPAVTTSVRGLRDAILAGMPAERSNLLRAAADSHPLVDADQVDTLDFLTHYAAKTTNPSVLSAISDVLSRVQDAVVAHDHADGRDESLPVDCGLAIYMPTNRYDYDHMCQLGDYYRDSLPFNQQTHWYDVIMETWKGAFCVDLSWELGWYGAVKANIDLWIKEPDGNLASCSEGTPHQGVMSGDSSVTGKMDEWYNASVAPASGTYEIWVHYRENVEYQSASPSVWVDEPDGTYGSYGPVTMDLSTPNDTAKGPGWWYVGSVTVP